MQCRARSPPAISSWSAPGSGRGSFRDRDRYSPPPCPLTTIPSRIISSTGSGIPRSSSTRCAWRLLQATQGIRRLAASGSLCNSAARCLPSTDGSFCGARGPRLTYSLPSCSICAPTQKSLPCQGRPCWPTSASTRTARLISPVGHAPRPTGRRYVALLCGAGGSNSRTWMRRSATALQELISADLAFTLSSAHKPCFDIWEEVSGYHYYTQLLQAEALTRGAEWLEQTGQHVRERVCRAAADELAPQLDAFWNDAGGCYRSHRAAHGRRARRGAGYRRHSCRASCRARQRQPQRARPQGAGDTHRPGGAFRS